MIGTVQQTRIQSARDAEGLCLFLLDAGDLHFLQAFEFMRRERRPQDHVCVKREAGCEFCLQGVELDERGVQRRAAADHRAEIVFGSREAERVVFACAFIRSEEHTSELQSLMRISYAVFCLKKKTQDIMNTQ